MPGVPVMRMFGRDRLVVGGAVESAAAAAAEVVAAVVVVAVAVAAAAAKAAAGEGIMDAMFLDCCLRLGWLERREEEGDETTSETTGHTDTDPRGSK